MNEMTQHELNIIRMQMNIAKNSIVEEYEKSNKEDRFSRKVVNDYQRIIDKLDRMTSK